MTDWIKNTRRAVGRNLSMTVLACLWAGGAGMAAADGPGSGCYVRGYSDEHLARNPAQVVRQIRLRIFRQDGGDTAATMRVLTSDQGHVAQWGQGGQVFDQFLICWSEDGRDLCAVECDGGLMEIVRQDGRGLTFRTRYLMVGETGECGGAVDLAEVPGQPVSYKLYRADPADCAGMN